MALDFEVILRHLVFAQSHEYQGVLLLCCRERPTSSGIAANSQAECVPSNCFQKQSLFSTYVYRVLARWDLFSLFRRPVPETHYEYLTLAGHLHAHIHRRELASHGARAFGAAVAGRPEHSAGSLRRPETTWSCGQKYLCKNSRPGNLSSGRYHHVCLKMHRGHSRVRVWTPGWPTNSRKDSCSTLTAISSTLYRRDTISRVVRTVVSQQ